MENKKIVRQNIGKSISRSDYLKTECYLMGFKFYVYLGFFYTCIHLITNTFSLVTKDIVSLFEYN
jgi:hypothetical protein